MARRPRVNTPAAGSGAAPGPTAELVRRWASCTLASDRQEPNRPPAATTSRPDDSAAPGTCQGGPAATARHTLRAGTAPPIRETVFGRAAGHERGDDRATRASDAIDRGPGIDGGGHHERRIERAGQESGRLEREIHRGPGGAGGSGREPEHEKAAGPRLSPPSACRRLTAAAAAKFSIFAAVISARTRSTLAWSRIDTRLFSHHGNLQWVA